MPALSRSASYSDIFVLPYVDVNVTPLLPVEEVIVKERLYPSNLTAPNVYFPDEPIVCFNLSIIELFDEILESEISNLESSVQEITSLKSERPIFVFVLTHDSMESVAIATTIMPRTIHNVLFCFVNVVLVSF